MKYLIISTCSLGLFLVPRLNKVKEVEKIYFQNVDTHYKTSGKGLAELDDWSKLEVITEYTKALNESSKEELVIVIDDVGAGQTGEFLRKQGYKVIGGTPFTDRIEEDRQFATDLMGKIMDVPPSTSFKDWSAAIQFVKSHDKEERLVFKPNDSEAGKEYTYVSKDVKDMVSKMEQFRSEWKYKEDFQIQEFIKGVEVDFSGYFNGTDYIENSMLIYFENKAFMDKDVGPATGGSIAVEFAYPPKGIFWDILQKLKPALQKAGYRGQLAINSMVSEKDHKPYFLEFCGRFGYPSLPIDVTLVEDNEKTFHQLLMAIANGEQNKNLFPTNKIAVTVSVFVPPAPTGEAYMMEATGGQPISWDSKYDEYFFPYYVMGEKGKMVLCGTNTWVLNVTCADQTLDGAVSMLYDDYLPTLKLKSAMHRSDLGKSAKERIKKLREFKLI